jgi:hypothetical protein
VQALLTLIKFLPEFIRLAKFIQLKIKEGHTTAQIKDMIKASEMAFLMENRSEAASALNDIWNPERLRKKDS